MFLSVLRFVIQSPFLPLGAALFLFIPAMIRVYRGQTVPELVNLLAS